MRKGKSMANFTAGPWIAEHQGPESANAYAILTDKGWVVGHPWIAQAFGQNVGPLTAEETQANVKLITAAPDLYEALKGVMGLIDSGYLVRDTSGDVEPGWAMRQIQSMLLLANAEKALAKAVPHE